MKKSIALFGGSYFNTIEYNEFKETIQVFNSEYLTLATTYNVSNYTFYDKPISYHYEFIKNLLKFFNVDEAILAFGDYEALLDSNENLVFVNNFKRIFNNIVALLVEKGIAVRIRLLKEDNKIKIALNKAMLEVLDNNLKLESRKEKLSYSLCLI